MIQDFLRTEKGLCNEGGGRGWMWMEPKLKLSLILKG